MPRPKPRYTLFVVNHEAGAAIKIELVDLRFPGARSYRLRVNGAWAIRVPVASKTIVLKQLRACLVKR